VLKNSKKIIIYALFKKNYITINNPLEIVKNIFFLSVNYREKNYVEKTHSLLYLD